MDKLPPEITYPSSAHARSLVLLASVQLWLTSYTLSLQGLCPQNPFDPACSDRRPNWLWLALTALAPLVPPRRRTDERPAVQPPHLNLHRSLAQHNSETETLWTGACLWLHRSYAE